MPRQLPLPFDHQPHYDPRDFIAAGSNQDALAWLEADWPEQRLALFGPEGCGKSHVVHIWMERTSAVLLAGPMLAGRLLADLDCIPEHGALALDDADRFGDERMLFHLLNTARDRGLRLLLTGRSAPSRWPVRLPDLSSRLRAITTAEIGPPDDALLAALLKRLVGERQLAMTQAAQDWVLHHLDRSPAVIRKAVDWLDRESLASGVAITRAFTLKVLKEGDFAIAETDEVAMSGGVPSPEGCGSL